MEQKEKVMLKPEAILRYLMGDEQLHTLITCNNKVTLITTDQNLYEALGCVEDRNQIDLNLLVKMLEVTEIVPHAKTMNQERKILTPERAQELRMKNG